MHQYWYLNAEGNGEQYNNQISMSSLYSQPQITKAEEMNDLNIPENWSCRVLSIWLGFTSQLYGFQSPTPSLLLGSANPLCRDDAPRTSC